MATATAPETEVLEHRSAMEPEGLYEVVDGLVREKPEMGAYEAALASVLGSLLDNFGRTNRIGQAFVEALFRLDHDQGLQRRPDVAFVSTDRWPLNRRPPRGEWAWDVIPDLAVEVISPTNRTLEDFVKIREYFPAGVRLVWMVLPAVDQIYVFHSPTEVRVLQRGDVLDGESVIPGFRVEVNELFGES
jgi:Uma2 family endonuclease